MPGKKGVVGRKPKYMEQDIVSLIKSIPISKRGTISDVCHETNLTRKWVFVLQDALRAIY